MAALVAGVQYGLSSHSNFHENKSLIFVKLTDSAQRAIEDFLRNRNKTSQNPTIQFLGNEGQLSFPSTQSSHGSAGFTFSLSGNQDIEGPQGGFECIQQTGPKSLESLGALPCKMRIQANDDVYETTRHRMAVAEENNKNKCTRVIKPNRPDIGRKVKVKATGRPIPSPSNSRHRESTSIPTFGSQPRLSSSTYKPAISNPPPARSQPEKKVSDVMRRPLKERLIHLLALRPYKKPELYDRINREGIKERERSIMTMILKQVAFMRDNTYHLHRYVWNDVQEDWPYYTEQEKAMLKRRKPQNLTPPGSSDGGSSGSGQSPNSTHPGSPPAITAPPPSLSAKRPGYYQGNDGLPTKKQRVSRCKKPEPSSGSTNPGENGRTAGSVGSSSSSNSVSGAPGGSSASGSGGGSGVIDGWDQRQHPRDRRGDYRPERTANSDVLRGGGYGSGKPCTTPTSDSEENNRTGHRDVAIIGTSSGSNATSNATSSHNSHSSVAHSNSLSGSRHHHVPKTTAAGPDSITIATDFAARSMPSAVTDGGSTGSSYSGSSNGVLADRRDRSDRNDRGRGGDKDRESKKRNSGTSSSNSYNDLAGNGDSTVTTSTCNLDLPESPKSSEYPDYLTYYTTISSAEQRRRYKAEFNADYEEYRRLHTQVAKVSKRFSQLQDRLRQEEASGNWEEYQGIRQQILYEYNETKRDPVHKETKRRFHYLHEKLSHIKRLVLEYDTQNCGGNMVTASGNSADGSNEMKEMDSLHY
ncbi:RNA polymerase II elongation factor Ell [Hylaeus volcanicus]|uniref:RNA polymerase II elongation factor Ell n=1 Tax=Hylaeus volcanicus TaxID=313075 RepID=UPI0023B7C547|nr:RNA polymerase II elongation factor Ell [Hylaeus volcanicus]